MASGTLNISSSGDPIYGDSMNWWIDPRQNPNMGAWIVDQPYAWPKHDTCPVCKCDTTITLVTVYGKNSRPVWVGCTVCHNKLVAKVPYLLKILEQRRNLINALETISDALVDLSPRSRLAKRARVVLADANKLDAETAMEMLE